MASAKIWSHFCLKEDEIIMISIEYRLSKHTRIFSISGKNAMIRAWIQKNPPYDPLLISRKKQEQRWFSRLRKSAPFFRFLLIITFSFSAVELELVQIKEGRVIREEALHLFCNSVISSPSIHLMKAATLFKKKHVLICDSDEAILVVLGKILD